jgi:hypothetical protein
MILTNSQGVIKYSSLISPETGIRTAKQSVSIPDFPLMDISYMLTNILYMGTLRESIEIL